MTEKIETNFAERKELWETPLAFFETLRSEGEKLLYYLNWLEDIEEFTPLILSEDEQWFLKTVKNPIHSKAGGAYFSFKNIEQVVARERNEILNNYMLGEISSIEYQAALIRLDEAAVELKEEVLQEFEQDIDSYEMFGADAIIYANLPQNPLAPPTVTI